MSEVDLVLFHLRSGVEVSAASYTALSWNSPLTADSGKLDATLRIPDDLNRRIDLAGYTAPWKYGLAAVHGRACYWAGPISTRSYDSGLSLSVSAVDIWQLLNMRGLLGSYTATKLAPTTMDTTFSSATLYGLARAVVAKAMDRPGGELPMTLPDEEPGSTQTLTYHGYEPKKAGEALTEIAAMDGGPELLFAPSYNGQQVGWTLLAGRPLLTQEGSDIAWHTAGANVRTGDVPWNETAELYTTCWCTGNGQERDMKSSRADNPALLDAGYPAMDLFDTGHTDDSVTQAMLDGFATGNATRYALPTQNTSVSVRTDMDPVLSAYRPGYRVLLTVDGHPLLGDTDLRHRIIDIKVDAVKVSAELTLDTAVGGL